MSQENVEFVRSICAAWDRGDYGAVEWADPDIEFVAVGGPQPGTWGGLPGMAEGWREMAERVGGLPSGSGRIPRTR